MVTGRRRARRAATDTAAEPPVTKEDVKALGILEPSAFRVALKMTGVTLEDTSR